MNKESWEEIEEVQKTSIEQSELEQISSQKREDEYLILDVDIDRDKQATQPKKSKTQP